MPAQIGVTGLAVMGANLARNFARNGYTVALHNRSVGKTDALLEAHGDEGDFIRTESLEELVANLETPRRVLIMVKAGGPVDSVIDQLVPLLEEGDVVIDAGNSHYTDTRRREAALAEKGLHFVGIGVSGGEEGALLGPSIMPGGSAESYKSLGPMLEKISAKADDGAPCCAWISTDGAGHFVKMVHNGIEYADMQVIGEAYDLMRSAAGIEPAKQSEIFNEWNQGELSSFLIEITAEVLGHVDASTGKPLVDVIQDSAGQKGTGRWTVQSGLDMGSPVSAIAESVFARSLSSQRDIRAVGQKVLTGETAEVTLPENFVEDVRQALFASKLVSYAQGLDMLTSAAGEYNWDLKLDEIAGLWREGCIIRAALLKDITAAYSAGEKPSNLLFAPAFAEAINKAVPAWRRVVSVAVQLGIPAPVFSSSLAYYDGLRRDRLPAALTQGLRDYFGAHTYRRTDKEGTFHTQWSGDRTEIAAEDTH
ncbi:MULTISPECIES: NADP-dependent phosphogluconate dehydrogenase [Micrococcaceae]|uniref:NADP-dependent phosphogluconate dehydrogenase n=2 Tax=Micrococcales TaxID=85006 RepID=UPI000CFB0CB0|nr:MULTISPECIES: NADP-dependent phosphogluconate dehydrogenase [unclassified Arthrobacter]MCS3491954.1 6-phosphogluconate dehydrogenase [Arthrobacter sp. JUb119]PQZ87104.1 phosphogluconate dehydrogenase (NADP(+)-dependent, decarboxylating) [Arthrobacter sp. MYb222]PRB78056.1 phosphogluconate dehydrogenase (NADP(+)-dependent, decarboxylating) [Arthrobacter sp. MYb214]TDU29584.1 6-phosphogluconate dehydrogenase (decarboxylating) [Arthrobacter sp. JUb115]